jgi:hypothetical protein
MAQPESGSMVLVKMVRQTTLVSWFTSLIPTQNSIACFGDPRFNGTMIYTLKNNIGWSVDAGVIIPVAGTGSLPGTTPLLRHLDPLEEALNWTPF